MNHRIKNYLLNRLTKSSWSDPFSNVVISGRSCGRWWRPMFFLRYLQWISIVGLDKPYFVYLLPVNLMISISKSLLHIFVIVRNIRVTLVAILICFIIFIRTNCTQSSANRTIVQVRVLGYNTIYAIYNYGLVPRGLKCWSI